MFKKLIPLALAFLLPQLAHAAPPAEPRQVLTMNDGWRFQFGEADASVTTAAFDDSGWEQVSVPHTWNSVGEYALERSAATNNKQGVGWYRLHYNAPASAKGRRQYLDFAAVAIIADVWVNGVHVGQHKGGFSRFRFDVTAAWKPGATNLIVVKADNSKPAVGSTTQDVMPLAGDFFIHGGIYRGVQLIEANDVGIDLLDFGGPGVYATLSAIEDAVYPSKTETILLEKANARISMKTRLRNLGKSSRKVRALITISGQVCEAQNSHCSWQSFATKRSKSSKIASGGAFDLMTEVVVPNQTWDGTRAPNLLRARVDIVEGGTVIDTVTQSFGIRDFQFDPNAGFFLNGNHLKLHGVSRHQDREGKGYALTAADHAEDMALIKELGANSIRQAHYQHADEWTEEADKAGMIVWAEIPFVTTPSLTGGEGNPELWANAEQQLRELIRQNYNHPSIAMWSIGNEVDASALFGVTKNPVKPLKLLRHLQEIAKAEDPSRPTIFADCCEDVRMLAPGTPGNDAGDVLAGAADMVGYNRYYGWYYPQPLKVAEQLATQMDKFHVKHPALPIAISEYGAGGAVNQHSDNPIAGFINAIGRPQPEEYESWVHEQSWPVIRDRDYIFGSYVWNMFDFASDLRNEGDSVDINTKGLVTFDRKTKKDAFYYYKAQWSSDPFIHITGKHYVDRAYAAMDVRAYTTEKRAQLQVGTKNYGSVDCPDHICVWSNVALTIGANDMIVQSGAITDTARFNGPDPAQGIRLDAGDNAGRMIGGKQFGSDNFVTGGTSAVLNQGGFGGRRSGPPRSVIAPNPVLFDYWREGAAFTYSIPLPDGIWTVIVHSFEPRAQSVPAEMMTISADGKIVVPAFNIAKDAGGPLRAITKSFTVTVTGGLLKLDFAGQGGGNAVVAAMEFRR